MKTKNEVLEFLKLHMPIAIEPKTKGNKTKLQNPFVSQHAFNVCCEHLAENLTEWINEYSQSLEKVFVVQSKATLIIKEIFRSRSKALKYINNDTNAYAILELKVK